jgi:acetate kinase
MKILALNGGSSSIKASLFEIGEAGSPDGALLWQARLQWGRKPRRAEVHISRPDSGAGPPVEIEMESPADALDPMVCSLWRDRRPLLGGPAEIGAVGHRVVHGGRALRESARIDAGVKQAIARAAEFAPEHNRLELAIIEAMERTFGPGTPQVAVFDTAFHSTLTAAASTYPGPYEWLEQGIRRYGFHGISHQYVSRRAAEILGRAARGLRLITCHLGNGCSLAAVRDGRSVDTTMGFTPLDGLMMGSRSGSVDPGILIYLARDKNCTADQLDRLLNQESGLKGVSGVSEDIRDVLKARAAGDERARLAFEVYVHRLVWHIGAMAASAGGVDALVFTAGVGENSPEVRAAACERLRFLGVGLDAARNAGSRVDEDVAAADSAVRVLVVRTEEDREIARECARLATRRA